MLKLWPQQFSTFTFPLFIFGTKISLFHICRKCERETQKYPPLYKYESAFPFHPRKMKVVKLFLWIFPTFSFGTSFSPNFWQMWTWVLLFYQELVYHVFEMETLLVSDFVSAIESFWMLILSISSTSMVFLLNSLTVM